MKQRLPARARLATSSALLLAALTSSMLPSSALATERPGVSIGDVSIAIEASAPGDTGPELGRALRAALNDELSRVAGLTPVRRPLILSATLTRLSSERRADRTKTTASISLALMRADDQVLFAELRGRASVEEASANPASLRRAALQGAVHGALARLPELVQKAR